MSFMSTSMMNEILVILGGVYTVLLIIFHVMFWRIFKWPETLMSLSVINRSTMQVLNISITFIFFIFAYLSFVHTHDLLNSRLGQSVLSLIACFWLFRAGQQVVFYKLKSRVSLGLTLCFLIGALLYGIPVIL